MCFLQEKPPKKGRNIQSTAETKLTLFSFEKKNKKQKKTRIKKLTDMLESIPI